MTKKQSMSLTAINNALKKLTADMNRQFKRVDRRFEQVDRRFEQVDENLTKLFSQHHDLDKYVKEEVATKDELKELKDWAATRFDEHSTILSRLDSERVVTNHRLKRLEDKVFVS